MLVKEAYDMLMKMKRSGKMLDIYSYTAVMNGFCKVGRTDEAMELINEAMERGLVPSVVTFNTLFTGYCEEGRAGEGWEKFLAALRIYKKMLDLGYEVDGRMMNGLVRVICKTFSIDVDLLKEAFQVFEKMKNKGATTCLLVIQSLCTVKEANKAFENLKEMF
ncbi:Pentatricopeptide repeat [Dillenia turbinata]|uniref:Pentatricopeptide repeat n=1 Tax=Dillenia turbinata TaxID=194707 RepID=A0AAN8YSK0_9MAGN